MGNEPESDKKTETYGAVTADSVTRGTLYAAKFNTNLDALAVIGGIELWCSELDGDVMLMGMHAPIECLANDDDFEVELAKLLGDALVAMYRASPGGEKSRKYELLIREKE